MIRARADPEEGFRYRLRLPAEPAARSRGRHEDREKGTGSRHGPNRSRDDPGGEHDAHRRRAGDRHRPGDALDVAARAGRRSRARDAGGHQGTLDARQRARRDHRVRCIEHDGRGERGSRWCGRRRPGGPPPDGARAKTNTGSPPPSSTARSGARLTSTTIRAFGWRAGGRFDGRLGRRPDNRPGGVKRRAWSARAGRRVPCPPGGAPSILASSPETMDASRDPGTCRASSRSQRARATSARPCWIAANPPSHSAFSWPGSISRARSSPVEGVRREPVAGKRRLGFRPVHEEGRGVAEQRMRPPVRGDRLIEALLHHPRAGQEEPTLGVGGIGRELRGKRVDHRFHVRPPARRRPLRHAAAPAWRRRPWSRGCACSMPATVPVSEDCARGSSACGEPSHR